MMYREHTIGVVVPAYNESELIGETLASIPEYVDAVYAIDDASTDDTADIIENFDDPRIVFIRHEKNSGVGAAIVSGYKRALEDGIDIAAVMAGDNQMDPEYLPSLLDPIVEGRAEHTKGNRLLSPGYRRGMSKWRSFGNSILTFLTKIASGYWYVVDPQNGYTAISGRALKMLNLDRLYRRYAFENDLLVKLNVHDAKVINIPIPARYGRETSHIKYHSFIIKTSLYFIKALLWRAWKKYLVRLNPIGLFYIVGGISMIIGVFALFFSNWMILTIGTLLFAVAALLEVMRDRRLQRDITMKVG